MRFEIPIRAAMVTVAAFAATACGGPSSDAAPPAASSPPSPGAPMPQQAPAPAILGFRLQPNPTLGQNLVVLVGSGFQTGAALILDGVMATNVGVDPAGTSIIGIAPAQPTGSVTVGVTNPDGRSATLTGSDVDSPPSASGGAASGAPGSSYLFGGLSFLAPKVFFGMVPAPIVSIAAAGRFAGSLQQITVHVPSLPSGTYEVIVVNSDGQFSTVQPMFVVP